MENPHARSVSISFAVGNARGELLAGHRPDAQYYAASTMKLAVLLAAGRGLKAGTLDWTATYPWTRTFTGVDGHPFRLTGDHLDPEFPPESTPVPVTDLLEAMISRSSNEATNMLMREVGLPAIEGVLRDFAVNSTRIERLIGDEAAEQRGLSNITTARDLVTLMHATANGWEGPCATSLGLETTRFFQEILKAQRTAPIGRALPAGTVWGSKSGEVPGIRHDVAFVGDPGAKDCQYLSICTRGYTEEAADEAIAALVTALMSRPRSS